LQLTLKNSGKHKKHILKKSNIFQKSTESDEEGSDIATDDPPPPISDNAIVSWHNLPHEIQKKCNKMGLPKEMMLQHFQILWNTCEFLFPEYFPHKQAASKAPRAPYASEEMRALAEKETTVTNKQNLKKFYGKLKDAGKGGFASVYSCRDLSRKYDLIAIKRLHHNTERERHTNFSEIGFLMTCSGHTNIVQYIRS